MHFDGDQATQPSQTPEKKNSSSNESRVSLLSSQDKNNYSENCTTVLLDTTLLNLTTSNGNSCVQRALLDTASMCNFISEEAAQLLRPHRIKSDLVITGIYNNFTEANGIVKLSSETVLVRILLLKNPFVY